MRKERYVFGGLLALFLLLFALETLALYSHEREMATMHRGMVEGMHRGMVGFGWSFWILLALLALFLYYLSKEQGSDSDPREILKARYARGEVTRGEMMDIVLYTREECPLCEEAKEVLDEVRKERPFEYREIDITTSPELARKYKNLIPVLAIDGEVAFVGRVDAKALRARLEGQG